MCVDQKLHDRCRSSLPSLDLLQLTCMQAKGDDLDLLLKGFWASVTKEGEGKI